MLLSGRVVAGRLARVGLTPRRFKALSAWAVLLGSISACGTDPRIPTTVTLSTSAISFTALGQTQQLFPAVSDQDGKPLAGADVSWTSSNTGLATVSPSGVVTAVGAGTANITVSSGSATANVQVTVVQTPTQLLKVSGDAQTSTAGTALPAPLVVQLNDAGGSPIPGRTATFTVTQGDGVTTTTTVVTGGDGRASTSFTTGTASGAPQGVSASIASTALSVSFTATAAADPASFNIGLQYLSTVSASQRQAFTAARLRWQGVITQDLEDGLVEAPAEDCGPGSPAVSQDIDDVVILVSVVTIDGQGGVLASAGPCYARDFPPLTTYEPGDLTVLGAMLFDADDLQDLESDGLLSDVVLHEMGHVLGFGTLWDLQGFLADPSLPNNPSADPHFTGAQARGAFDLAGGAAYTGGKVPVDNSVDLDGIPLRGTADSHWRELEFETELMTGFIGTGLNPLSRITIASLADQGYAVDLAAADAFSLLRSLRAFDTRPKLLLKNDILRGPIRTVDRRGRVTGMFRR
jgi:Big-like domain-containing protein